jgi:hypothetical protein
MQVTLLIGTMQYMYTLLNVQCKHMYSKTCTGALASRAGCLLEDVRYARCLCITYALLCVTSIVL